MEEPCLEKFLRHVKTCETLQQLKQIFPGDDRTQYDKRYSKARKWVRYYSKSGLVKLGRKKIPTGNYQYTFSLTQRGKNVLERLEK